MSQQAYVKGLLEPIILKLLQEHGAMYGYEITQKVKALTGGDIQITEGALYPLLHKLETNGMITAELVEIQNRQRKYYSLTKAGKKETAVAIDDLRRFMQHLQLIFTSPTTS